MLQKAQRADTGRPWLAGQFGRFAKLLRTVDIEVALQHLSYTRLDSQAVGTDAPAFEALRT